MKVILVGLVTWVVQMMDWSTCHLRNELSQVTDAVRLGHLIQDAHALSGLRRVVDGQLDTAASILEMNEGAGLAAGPVHREWVADCGLHKEAIQHRAVVTIIVK